MLGRLFRMGRRAAPDVVFPAPAPRGSVFAVGDIHGRADLLDRLLAQIDRRDEPGARRIFLGDYVDRGEDSQAVLRRLFELSRAAPDKVTCLLGNHEKMMLDFLDDAEGRGRWLRFGGLQTLASFSVGGVTEGAPPQAMLDAAGRLRDAMGADLEAWMRNLMLRTEDGNLHFLHAGADPSVPLDAQEPSTLLWGHGDFATTPRDDGLWVVHGHTVVEAPNVASGRINVDTGAWFSGRLSAVRLAPGEIEFLST